MIVDSLILIALILLGKLQFKYRAVKVAGFSAVVSTVALTPLFLIMSILAVMIFKWAIVILFLAIAAIAKLKMLAFLKVGVIIAGAATGVAGIFSGPLGWVALLIVTVFFFGYLINFSKDAFFWIYEKYLLMFSKILANIRNISNYMQEKIGQIGVVLFFPFEFFIVSLLPIYGLYEIWSYFSGEIYDSDREKVRFLLAAAYSVITYVDYRRATGRSEEIYPDAPDILDVDGPAL